MQKILILLLIISPLYLFGQVKKTKFVMKDKTVYKGRIVEESETELVLVLKKRQLITLSKSEISYPEQNYFQLANYTTVVKTTDGNRYQGNTIMEDDNQLTIEVGKETNISIEKSTIVYRRNVSKVYKNYIIEVILSTKDGNAYSGNVVEKTKEYVVLDMPLGRKKFDFEDVVEYSEKMNEFPKLRRVAYTLCGVSIGLILLGML